MEIFLDISDTPDAGLKIFRWDLGGENPGKGWMYFFSVLLSQNPTDLCMCLHSNWEQEDLTYYDFVYMRQGSGLWSTYNWKNTGSVRSHSPAEPALPGPGRVQLHLDL